VAKSIGTYYIDSDVLEAFEKNKAAFVKSQLVEFWIKQFLEKNKEFIPK